MVLVATEVSMSADVRLFDYGAEGYCADVGQTVYDIIAQSYGEAAISTTMVGDVFVEDLVLIDAISALIPTPRIVRYDMALTDWTLTDHNWQVPEVPVYSNKRFLRLAQPQPYVNAEAVSKWEYPQGADIGFDLIIEPPVRCEYSAIKHAPFVFISFGGNEWGIWYQIDDACRLMHWDVDEWRTEADLSPQSEQISVLDTSSASVLPFIILNYRGYLCVSTDYGRTYKAVGDGVTTLKEGPITVHWYGVNGGFAAHQLYQKSGTYEPRLIPLFEDHTGEAAVKETEAGYHYLNPVSFDDEDPLDAYVDIDQLSTWGLNQPGGDWFSYRATLAPKAVTQPLAPFTFYDSPCLMAVQFGYGSVVVAPNPTAYTSLTSTTEVLSIDVTLPRQIDAGTADVELLLDPEASLTGEYRRRYMEIDLGYQYDDASQVRDAVLAGYIVLAKTRGGPGWASGGHILKLDIVDASYAGKGMAGSTVDESWAPLDSMPMNTALTYCAGKIGIHSTRMNWYDDGDTVLDSGPAEKPIWWRTGEVRLGMAVWDVMVLIANLKGFELFVAPDGIWTTWPRAYTSGTDWAFDAASPANYLMCALEVEYEAAVIEAATAVIATGEDGEGRQVAAWMIDFDRERDTSEALFTGRRQWRRFDGRRFSRMATAMGVVDAEYDRQAESAYILYWASRLQAAVRPADEATIANAEADGVNPTADHVIESVRHHLEPHIQQSSSRYQARRV